MTPLAEANGAAVYHADWRALLEVVPACDALIVDAPYSERTHKGHDGAVSEVRLAGEEKRMRVDRRTGAVYSVGVNRRREIDYAAWTPDDVRAFVEAWSPRVAGWIVSITDHHLAPAWQAALEEAGRYVFAPLPYYAPGSRVRLLGDGPSNWTTWIVVARPRSKTFAKWGTLPGGYVLPSGEAERMPVVGGKPTWLTRALARDYSRPGDLVVDPCCGGGSTLVGALREGRRAIGGDAMREHAELAAAWIGEAWATSPARAAVQPSLFGGAA